MLNIPTAKPKPAGTTSLGDAPAGTPGGSSSTALPQTTPYEYAGQGWNDPVAQQVMQNYYASTPGYSAGTYDQLRGMAEAGSTPGVQYNTPLDPSTWGTVYKGPDYDRLAQEYKAAGGTYYGSQTPAQQAGAPYYAATGEPAPVMNMATGMAENPLTKQPMSGGSGSSHTLSPDILSKMWR
jgi:hypothetical protein